MTLSTLPVGRRRVRPAWRVSLLVLSAAWACSSPRPRAIRDSAAGELADTVEPPSNRLATDATLSILSVGSVAQAMRILSDTFATREAVQVRRDTSTAVEAATSYEPKRTPDLVAVEEAGFSRLPRAAQITWYVRFATDSLSAAVQPPIADTTAGTAPRVNGRPIVYGLSIPSTAPNARYAERFVRFVLSPEGARILRAAHLDPLIPPSIGGTKAPPSIVALIGATGGPPPSQ